MSDPPKGQRWRWVKEWDVHHLARETCQGEWVSVCHALKTWPMAATPERIRLTDGTTRWALKTKVDTIQAYRPNVRVKLSRSEVCKTCLAHAREIARLAKGVTP